MKQLTNNKHLRYFNVHYVNQLKTFLQNIFKINIQNRKLDSDIIIKISVKHIRLCTFFFNKHALCLYKQLVDLVAYDRPSKTSRFTINYNLSSILYTTNLILSVKTNELQEILTTSKIFQSAVWLEREVWDLYGIFFFENDDLRRILTDYGFTGHPLRKDFPLTGFIEVYYSYENHIIMFDQAELSQELRVFTLES